MIIVFLSITTVEKLKIRSINDRIMISITLYKYLCGNQDPFHDDL